MQKYEIRFKVKYFLESRHWGCCEFILAHKKIEGGGMK